ncbi:CPBP family glutamic-type intramembrane protease [Robertmurraya sp. DFI.2.37]|nr:CPBP family glutamic-type intramembrane protease [Robertmurraya sp. DFI.2.37]MDF1508603.1 CPBP family glutamic-type intramembrane protease [Robertmurraya sp. DFI.2.37]
MISSSLFAITHSLQLLGGQSLEDTLLQIIYAFVVGMVLSLLIINNQSIIMAIAFHGLNNSLQLMGQDQGSSIFSYVIIAILITYSIFLWMRASNATILK